MARGPVLFRQADLTRALRGARAAGVNVGKIEIDPVTGKITITSATEATTDGEGDPLDKWMANHASPT
jgi:hypothetical protein